MNRFVIANPSECIGCHVCEVACVLSHHGQAWPLDRSHFRPRIHLVAAGEATVPLTCRQCNNAPCVASCPCDALVAEQGSIRLREEKCIGCKNCLLACPFGAIEQAISPELVMKCDLCQHASQPACVSECPTQALQLMDEATLTGLQQHRQRASAGSEPRPETGLGQQRLEKPPRIGARKCPADERKQHFNEIYVGLDEVQAGYETDRCIHCARKAWCGWICPLHNAIPDFIELAQQGRILEAAELSHQTSSLPEICGRVCPQDRLCEGACTLNGRSGAVTIGNIERYITDQALAQGWRPNMQGVQPRSERVAIIGAGPAGLGCADILIRQGVSVDVYDRHPEIGGLLTFGIPSFKLDKQLLTTRRTIFSEMGIRFHLNCEIGRDVTFVDVLKEYDAVLLSVGTYGLMRAGLEHEEAPGVMQALPYLIANTRRVMGLEDDPRQPYVSFRGKKVVVLGGGDTAMDCLRTAVRQQATQVICAYRRDEKSMPGSKKEVTNAREEGAEFMFNLQPQFIELDTAGRFSGIGMIRTVPGAPGADGRRRPQPLAGSEFVLKADALVMAFGFQAHEMPWLAGQGIRFDRWGMIKTGEQGRSTQTSNAKVFAAGDAVHGADLVVTAMAAGRRSAGEMIEMFNEQIRLREQAS